MSKYKISRGYGYAGEQDTIIIDAVSLEDAQEAAWEWALERVESCAELVEEDEDE